MNLGIEIGGTKLQLVTDTMTGQISQRFRYPVDPGQVCGWHYSPTIGYDPAPSGASPGYRRGFGGPVDWQTGRVATSHQIGGWAGFELAEWLQKQVPGAIVRVENDANVGALGEALQGAATHFQNVFYITLGSGVGGGMVVNRQIYHGARPGEAEIGHLWLVPPGDSSPGQTIEQTISGWAIDGQIRDLVPQLPDDSALKMAVQQAHTSGGVGKEARFLHPAYEAGDPAARMLIEQIGSVLALGLSHVVHLFHPDAIVLGGGLSLIGEPLRAAVEQALPRFVINAFQPAPVIVLAKLGEDAVPVGALALMMNDK